MKVKELIARLQKVNPEARVGIGQLDVTGWISHIDRVCLMSGGVVALDMADDMVKMDELETRKEIR